MLVRHETSKDIRVPQRQKQDMRAPYYLRLAGRKGDVDGGRTVIEAVDHRGIAGHSAALVLGNSLKRAIILRRCDLETAIDASLGLIKLTLGGIQVLQRNLRAGVGVAAKGGHTNSPFFWWWTTRSAGPWDR